MVASRRLKKALGTIMKGAGVGISVAGTINTIAPGLVPYLAGTVTGANNTISWWEKLGIGIIAVTAPQEISGWAIIVIGAIVGAIVYVVGKLVKRIAKSRFKRES